MAKETNIIFVYDTEMVQKEEDDPAKAILYFHPTWVSDQQKAALCGQIIGTIQCVKGIFSKPKVVSLQTGKFSIIQDGRYILAVGTDRNITDWLVEHRAKILYSLVKFFHKDFTYLAQIYTNESLSAKLYHIFETYLKMLVFGSNIFSNIPTLALPKSASNIFIEAIHVLECCQDFNNVLGGSMMYHNKIVATQLSADLTKRLILTDPYRIKCPAEIAEVNFDLPLGVQLLQVYISNKEYCKLLESSIRNRNVFQYLSNKSIRKNFIRNVQPAQETPLLSAMKRDQSLIFTAVPEEGSEQNLKECTFVPPIKKNRPKFLNLKSISIDESVETKPIKSKVTTPFCGQTSVCSTPMAELKKFVHQNPLSIFRNSDIQSGDDLSLVKGKDHISPNSVGILDKVEPYETLIASGDLSKIKSTSLANLSEIIINISKDTTQYFNFKNQAFAKIDLSPKKKKRDKRFKTITDPTFPVFKQDGTPVSVPYYHEYIKRNVESVQEEMEKSTTNSRSYSGPSTKISENLVSIPKTNDVEKPKLPVRNNNREHRKSLSLPLKSLSMDNEAPADTSMISRRYSSGVQLTPLLSKLSMLAFEEKSSGFGSREQTPCDYRGLTPTTQSVFTFPYNNSKYKYNKNDDAADIDDGTLQKCILFVCGQQDIVLTILLKENGCQEQNTIKKLWEICTEHLSKLEKQLSYCMETQSGASTHESEPYSYLNLDSDWDTTKRGGPWGTNDMHMLNSLHGDFMENKNINEILVRSCDGIIYAHNCGPTEVFYHETANANAGLPPPADPMGLVQLKAKRRLERDQSILLM